MILDGLTDCDLNARICKDLYRGLGDESSTEKKGFLRGLTQLGLDGGDERSHLESLKAQRVE